MEFPELGSSCSLSSCGRLDFLPIRCSGCHRDFCSSHWTYEKHNCVSSTPSASVVVQDVQAPVCPVCDMPVALRRPQGGQPELADVAVCRHWDEGSCSKSSKRKKRNGVCCVNKCKKKELVPITCSLCAHNVCLAHRDPLDHDCGRRQEMRRQETRQLRLVHQQQQRRVQRGVNNALRDYQGEMSEDEALARALQLSMNQGSQGQEQRNEPKVCLVS